MEENNPSLSENSTNIETVDKKPQQDKPPLFPTKQLASGAVRTYYGTNDTTELLQDLPNKVINERLDDVLEAVKTVDVTCDFARCRTKTNLMGQTCTYCQHRFCFKHSLPEIHGCGEAVKTDERKNFLKPKPQKQILKEADLVKAHKRLEGKLKDMSLARTPKPSSSGGGKKGKRK